MAEQKDTATPPATSGGITKDEVKALVAESLKEISAAIKDLGANQKVLADTLAADKKAAEQAAEAAKKEAKPEALTLDAVTKLLEEKLAAQQQTAATTAAKAAARQKVIDAKLSKVPVEFLSSLPDTDDEKVLGEAADKIVARVNEVLKPANPDVGGAAKDGGQTPGQATSPAAGLSGMSDGVAKLAASIKLPA